MTVTKMSQWNAMMKIFEKSEHVLVVRAVKINTTNNRLCTFGKKLFSLSSDSLINWTSLKPKLTEILFSKSAYVLQYFCKLTATYNC